MKRFKSHLDGSKSDLRGSKFHLARSKSHLQGSKFDFDGSKFRLEEFRYDLQGSKSDARAAMRPSTFETTYRPVQKRICAIASDCGVPSGCM